MILKALYDYYQMCGDLAPIGMEYKELGFILVISKNGSFVRFEDHRIDSKTANSFLVKKHVGRSSGIAPNYLYDNSSYVFGYAKEKSDKALECFTAFRNKVYEICELFPNISYLKAL